MIGITQPIVKHSIAVERADDVAQAVVDALRIATQRPARAGADRRARRTSRTAPARDATHAPVPARLPAAASGPNGRQVRRAAEALAAARRPVLYAGGGVVNADAAEELRALAALSGAPVTTTLMALGAFPASDPAVARDARHARHPGRELGDGRGRPDRRHRRALRRPRDRRAGRVRAAREGRAHRRRPDRDRQDRHRRTCRSSATRSSRWRRSARDERRKLDATPPLDEWWERIRGWQAAHPLPRARARRRLRRPRGRARRARRRARRRDRHHRRRPAPDVGRRPAALRRAAALDHERRARDDGLRPAGRARRPGRRARTRPSSASPARARS